MGLLAVLVYLAVGASSAALIVRVARSQRGYGPGARAQIHDAYEAAFLGGGPARVVEAAIAALHADGRLAIGGPGIVVVRRPVAHDPVERAVFDALAAAPNGALHELRRSVMRSPAVQEVGDGLAARGLLRPPGAHRALTVWGIVQGIGCVLAVPLSMVLTVWSFVAEEGDGTPFVFLVMPALIGGVVIGFTMANRSRRRISSAGQDAQRSFVAQYATVTSAAHLVAIHGLAGVPDPYLQAQLTAAVRVPGARTHSGSSWSSTTDTAAVWCASSPGGSGCGSSSCGSGSSGGSSCGGGSSSSCSSSSGGSSCGGGSSGGGD